MVLGKGHRVLPTKADLTLSRRRSQGSKGHWILCAVAVVFFAAVWSVGVSLWSHSVMTHEQEKEQAIENVVPERSFRMWLDDRDYLEFSKTLKSCIDKQKCLMHVPEGTTTHRIGILHPPGVFGELFTEFVERVVENHWGNDTDIVLLPTSHVPPYGYGKTHGLTKIIRLSVSPQMTHGVDVILQYSDGKDATLQDLRQVVRQLIRWHCRLSHVAAHTALLTVTLESLVEQSLDIYEAIRDFLNLDHVSPLDRIMDDGRLEVEGLVTSMHDAMNRIHLLLTKLNGESLEPIEDVVHSVIQEELDKTNNLKKWPCLSFWSVGEQSKLEDLTIIAKSVARAFSPNCTAEYSQCGVARDLCEARGDAKCK